MEVRQVVNQLQFRTSVRMIGIPFIIGMIRVGVCNRYSIDNVCMGEETDGRNISDKNYRQDNPYQQIQRLLFQFHGAKI